MVMELYLKRYVFGSKYTIGDFYQMGHAPMCQILEDHLPTPYVKVPKITCIPYGRYRVVWDFSNRFQKNTLHLLDVPQFEGVRIHAGNSDADTEGCPIPGKYDATYPGIVSHSRDTVKAIEALICPLLSTTEVYINIIS